MSGQKMIGGKWRTALSILALVLFATLFVTAQAQAQTSDTRDRQLIEASDGHITVYGQSNGSYPPPAGAQFRVWDIHTFWDSGWRSDFGIPFQVPTKLTGSHFQIEFSWVFLWLTPAGQSIELMDFQMKEVTANWTTGGSITVYGQTNLSPGAPAGAQFRITRTVEGHVHYDSGWQNFSITGFGFSVTGLYYGSTMGDTYTIEFGDVAGFVTPADKICKLHVGDYHAEVWANYRTGPYEINAVLSNPAVGTITSDNPVTGLCLGDNVTFHFSLASGWAVTGFDTGTTGGSVISSSNSFVLVGPTTGAGTVTINVTDEYGVDAVFSNTAAVNTWPSPNPVTGLKLGDSVTFNYTLEPGWTVNGASSTAGGTVTTANNTTTTVTGTTGPGTVTINVTYEIDAVFSDPAAGTITSINPVTGLSTGAAVAFTYTLNFGWTVVGASPGTTGGTVGMNDHTNTVFFGTTGPGTITIHVLYRVHAVFSDPTALSSWDSANPVTGLTAPTDVTFNYTLNPGWIVTSAGPGATGGTVTQANENTTTVSGTTGPGYVMINVEYATGQIQAFIEPLAAIDAGAQWRIVGQVGWRNAGTTANALVGTYTIEFKGINGDWITPGSRDVVVLKNNRVTTTGVYEHGAAGSLQVFIDPEDEVIPDGAMWRPAGNGTWLESGDIVHGLPPGPIGIQFKVAPGWILPDLQGSFIRASVVTRETGEYIRPLIIHFNDYNGNGTEDLAVFDGGTGVWSVAEAGLVGSAPAVAVFLERKFGKKGDIAAPGDYDGDGTADLAVYRESTGMYRVDGQFNLRRFGEKRDIPVPGDYDGDGTTDPALFRPTTGEWFIHGLFEAQAPADMVTTIDFGEFGDVPVPGDYDGDGRTDLGIFDVVTGEWRVAVYDEEQGEWVEKPRLHRVYGSIGDIPIQADYDGDGRTDLAFWRRSECSWNVRNQFELKLGRRDDIPIPNDWANLGRDLPTIFRMRNGRWQSAENLLKAKHGAGCTPLMSGR